MTSTNNKAAIDVFNRFETQLHDGMYTDKQLAEIIRISNVMVEQQLTVAPFFIDFLKAETALKANPDLHHLFSSWNQTLSSQLLLPNALKKNGQKPAVFFRSLFRNGYTGQWKGRRPMGGEEGHRQARPVFQSGEHSPPGIRTH